MISKICLSIVDLVTSICPGWMCSAPFGGRECYQIPFCISADFFVAAFAITLTLLQHIAPGK